MIWPNLDPIDKLDIDEVNYIAKRLSGEQTLQVVELDSGTRSNNFLIRSGSNSLYLLKKYDKSFSYSDADRILAIKKSIEFSGIFSRRIVSVEQFITSKDTSYWALLTYIENSYKNKKDFILGYIQATLNLHSMMNFNEHIINILPKNYYPLNSEFFFDHRLEYFENIMKTFEVPLPSIRNFLVFLMKSKNRNSTSFFHGDLHCGNILFLGDTPVIIDYESSGMDFLGNETDIGMLFHRLCFYKNNGNFFSRERCQFIYSYFKKIIAKDKFCEDYISNCLILGLFDSVKKLNSLSDNSPFTKDDTKTMITNHNKICYQISNIIENM